MHIVNPRIHSQGGEVKLESMTEGRKFENSDALFKHNALSGL